MSNEILAPENVALILGIAYDEARKLMRNGEIRSKNTNGKLRCLPADVAEYVGRPNEKVKAEDAQ